MSGLLEPSSIVTRLSPAARQIGLADLGAAGEGDFANAIIAANGRANGTARAGEAGDGLGGQACLKQNIHQLQGRERSVGGGLDEHGVAAGDGRADLVRHEVEREIKRRNGRDNADGHAQGEPELARATRRGIERQHLAREAARFIGGKVNRLRRARYFELALGQDFAFLGGNEHADFVHPSAHQRGRFAQDFATLQRRHRARPIRTVKTFS